MWKRGDIARALNHDTDRWVKVKIRPAIVWNHKSKYAKPYACCGLGCNNKIQHRELHGGAKYLRFCLTCCKPLASSGD
jgi:hypothetical protein